MSRRVSVKFIVHHQGSQLGPWTQEEILKKINAKELDWIDYIYDEQKKDWVLMLEHPEFSGTFHSWKKPAAPAPVEAPEPKNKKTEQEWFILRDENKFGPFSYLELVKMLQEKKLFEFDFVWNRSKMDSWRRVADVADFSPEKIESLRSSASADVKDIFFRRRHARAKYGASLLIHNNKEVWRAQSIELSAGGAAILLEGTDLQVGQTLFLHFKAGDGVPPFNATCTVASKQGGKGKEHRYGLKFTNISQSVQQAIQKLATNAA